MSGAETSFTPLIDAVTPECFEWDNGGVIEQVVAYAKLDGNRDFVEWVVLSGNPPPSLTTIDALSPCDDKTLPRPVPGKTACYGAGIPGAEYTNADNSTDITFSHNASTLKWELDIGQEPGADAITAAIVACINAGEIAEITMTGANGVNTVFSADTIIQDGNANGGFWAFTGTGPGGFADKLSSATLVCGDGNSGVAQQWQVGCDTLNNPILEWRDCETGLIIDPAQIIDCPPTDCAESVVQFIACATEAVTDVTIGDQLLTVAVIDCTNTLVRSTVYNLSNGNAEITDAVNTEACDPEPQVEEIRECIIDKALQQWTQISILDPGTGAVVQTLFINALTLELGTPEGDPDSWTDCSSDCYSVTQKEICIISKGVKATKSKTASKTKAQSTSAGKKLNVCKFLFFDCTGDLAKTSYDYLGRIFTEEQYDAYGFREYDCDLPEPKYSIGATTCATTPVDGNPVVLNCVQYVSIEPIDPTLNFVVYSYADDYTAIIPGAVIGEVFAESLSDDGVFTACPPGTITETFECFKALNDIKLLDSTAISAGTVINVQSVNNAITGNTFYTITVGDTVIYSGTDPVGEAGIDVSVATEWEATDCVPVEDDIDPCKREWDGVTVPDMNQVVQYLPESVETKATTQDWTPASVEGAAGTVEDASALLTGGEFSPDNLTVNVIARYDLSQGQPECAVPVRITVTSFGVPDGGGWCISAYNDSTLAIIPSTLPGANSFYQQFNSNTQINVNGIVCDPMIPAPQAAGPGVNYAVTADLIVAGLTAADLANFALSTVAVNTTDSVGLGVEVEWDYSACDISSTEPAKQTIAITWEKNCNPDPITVDITNDCLTVKVQESETVEIVSGDCLRYPDGNGDWIYLQQVTVLQNPGPIVVNQFYQVIIGTAFSGTSPGDIYAPADLSLIEICPPGTEPQVSQTVICYVADVSAPGWSAGDKITCTSVYDIAAGPIGSGDETFLYVTYTLDNGSVVTGFDPDTQGTPCPVEVDATVEKCGDKSRFCVSLSRPVGETIDGVLIDGIAWDSSIAPYPLGSIGNFSNVVSEIRDYLNANGYSATTYIQGRDSLCLDVLGNPPPAVTMQLSTGNINLVNYQEVFGTYVIPCGVTKTESSLPDYEVECGGGSCDYTSAGTVLSRAELISSGNGIINVSIDGTVYAAPATLVWNGVTDPTGATFTAAFAAWVQTLLPDGVASSTTAGINAPAWIAVDLTVSGTSAVIDQFQTDSAVSPFTHGMTVSNCGEPGKALRVQVCEPIAVANDCQDLTITPSEIAGGATQTFTGGTCHCLTLMAIGGDMTVNGISYPEAYIWSETADPNCNLANDLTVVAPAGGRVIVTKSSY